MRGTAAVFIVLAGAICASRCAGSPTSVKNDQGSSGFRPQSIAISPTKATMESPDLTLTITAFGREFVSQGEHRSIAMWSVNGTDTLLATTFVNDFTLTAIVPATLLARPVNAEVSVQTDGAGAPGSASERATFVVVTPPPGEVPMSISPTSAVAGSADLQLTVTGSGFVDGHHNRSRVIWLAGGNPTTLETNFHSDSHLTAAVPAALLTARTTAEVFVETGDPMNDKPPKRSNVVFFSVR